MICSSEFTVCISSSGDIYSFGTHSKTGHGHKEEIVSKPTVISFLQSISIKSISCTDGNTVCVDENGSVLVFGSNSYGSLGIGLDPESFSFASTPQTISNLPPIKSVCCGYFFTIFLSENGCLYSVGDNYYGQLGIGNNEYCNSPQKIDTLNNVTLVSCGSKHVVCMTSNDDIYTWGDNQYGQLEIDDTDDYKPIPTKRTSWPKNIIDIKCSFNHTLVLTSNQEVFSCGCNYKGQLGRYDSTIKSSCSSSLVKIPSLSQIIKIECGHVHSMCIDINNDLYVFGDNRYGQLGLGDTDDRDKPMKHPSLSNIIDISSKGRYHTFVKTSNNEIYAFGNNEDSQLGIKTKDENQLTPIRVFEKNEDIWFSNINKSKAKSARF